MKLIRMGELGREKPGVLLDDGTRVDVRDLVRTMTRRFSRATELANFGVGLKKMAVRRRAYHLGCVWGSPICRPSKIVCIGLNFRDHAEESGMEIPKEPVDFFFKATSALVGPNDFLVIPKNATKVDWEVELAMVMGEKS